MTTHDLLAYAVATELVRRVNTSTSPWNNIFSGTCYLTGSRQWPIPDFVLHDLSNKIKVAGEFKPPNQSKREYLTGLGQATAYGRDFDYALLVVPDIAGDGYPIAKHIQSVLSNNPFSDLPVGLLSYDPVTLSPTFANFAVSHFFKTRTSSPTSPATLASSFYAKWREQSPDEVYQSLSYSYDEMRQPSSPIGNIRDRSFDKLWLAIQAGSVKHWAGGVRNYSNTATQKTAISKNYRNFTSHIGWTEADGSLTRDGLDALHVGVLYGAFSRPFVDLMARAILLAGKHLVLFNRIDQFQNMAGSFHSEATWLFDLETYLENEGLLKRNPARGAAAVAGSARQFFKAEKQLWKNLGLIVPYGPAQKLTYHPSRGLIFDWARITSLLS